MVAHRKVEQNYRLYSSEGKIIIGRQFQRWVDEIKAVAGKTWPRRGRDRTEWKILEETFCLQGK